MFPWTHPHHTSYSTAPLKLCQNILSLCSPKVTALSCFDVIFGLQHLIADHEAVLSLMCHWTFSAGSSKAEGWVQSNWTPITERKRINSIILSSYGDVSVHAERWLSNKPMTSLASVFLIQQLYTTYCHKTLTCNKGWPVSKHFSSCAKLELIMNSTSSISATFLI